MSVKNKTGEYQKLGIFLFADVVKAVGMGQIYGWTGGFEGLFQSKGFCDRFFILLHHLACLESALKLWGFLTFFFVTSEKTEETPKQRGSETPQQEKIPHPSKYRDRAC